MATAKKAAPKPGTKEYRPAEGICRHRLDGAYDCANPVRPATESRKQSVWCEKHIVAERTATKEPKAASKSPAARLAKANGRPLQVVPVRGGKVRDSKPPAPPREPVARVRRAEPIAAFVAPLADPSTD